MSNDILTSIWWQLCWQPYFFSLLIGQKQWREKKEERITTSCEYERESCPKVVKKWLSKDHFSKKILSLSQNVSKNEST
jgi:hypothetical protein